MLPKGKKLHTPYVQSLSFIPSNPQINAFLDLSSISSKFVCSILHPRMVVNKICLVTLILLRWLLAILWNERNGYVHMAGAVDLVTVV